MSAESDQATGSGTATEGAIRTNRAEDRTATGGQAGGDTGSTPPEGGGARAGGSTARLLGIDVARAVAILGMFASHVGPTNYGHPQAWMFLPFHGRAAVLFAVLAGISIAIMSGGREPATGLGWRKALVRIGSRAVLMLALGLVMNLVFIVPVWIILGYYGGFFLLSLPFLRLRARSLAVLSAVVIVAAPVVSWLIRRAYFPKDLIETPLEDIRPEQLTGVGDVVTTLLLTGVFPTFVWIGFVLAGMAIGRLDLTSPGVAKLLGLGGLALAAVAYGSSWVSLHMLGGIERIHASLAPHAGDAGIEVDRFLHLSLFKMHGTPPTDTPAWLLLPHAHNGTPFTGAGSVGLSLAVIGGCLLLQHTSVRGLRALGSVGAMSLTCYVGHLVVMQLLWGGQPDHSATNALLFIAGSVVFASVWRSWYGQGPLEKFVAKTSSSATRIVR
ncbi:DUF418 domain-containing protein [Saccharomonospora halophila]|uniref:DUF418 domain-containing protein n=1 Tax=Saccharomonospora halophila TaxID=129922 RepID=UPI0003723787|nr:DUF418 domain-containing protein [Saccharomonospora halophila]